MKKIIRMAAVIVAVAAMTCILFACGDGANANLEKLNERITELERQLGTGNSGDNNLTDIIEGLENKIEDLETEIANTNISIRSSS